MDAFELLKQDHKKVSKLFSKIESASGQAKSELFDQLKAELDLHAHIEETVLYPALENTEEAREITLEAYEEHKVVKDLLGELANAADQNEEWDAKLKVLKENVEHHVEEEEGELFGKARKALGHERIETLGADLEAEKASKSGAPKPRMATKSKPTAGRNNKTAKSESPGVLPGVLNRLANLVGLGASPSDKPDNSTRRPGKTPAKKSSKKQAAKSNSTSASKNASASKVAGKAASKASKSGPAKSAESAPKAAARKRSGEARTSKRATATSKKAASRGSRTSATKTASRAASNQRVKAGGTRGAKKARARKSSSGTRNKSR